MAENGYRFVVGRMTDEELVDTLKANENMYLDEMLLAVLDEVEKRKISTEGTEELRNKINARFTIEEPQPVEPAETKKVILPELYSQSAILAFSIFFSPLFGGVLLAMNVGKVNKKGVWQVILFSVIFTVFSVYVTTIVPVGNFIALLVPFAGALILSELLWNRFIGKNIPYQKRKIVAPLIIALIITVPIAVYIYYHPELVQMTEVSK